MEKVVDRSRHPIWVIALPKIIAPQTIIRIIPVVANPSPAIRDISFHDFHDIVL
jgi:hypothetical protein